MSVIDFSWSMNMNALEDCTNSQSAASVIKRPSKQYNKPCLLRHLRGSKPFPHHQLPPLHLPKAAAPSRVLANKVHKKPYPRLKLRFLLLPLFARHGSTVHSMAIMKAVVA